MEMLQSLMKTQFSLMTPIAKLSLCIGMQCLVSQLWFSLLCTFLFVGRYSELCSHYASWWKGNQWDCACNWWGKELMLRICGLIVLCWEGKNGGFQINFMLYVWWLTFYKWFAVIDLTVWSDLFTIVIS